MFTSRSEYRVSLRADNADLRLTEKGRSVRAVRDSRWSTYQSTKSDIEHGIELMERFSMAPDWWNRHGFEVKRDGNRRRWVCLLACCHSATAAYSPPVEMADLLCYSAFDLLHYKGVDVDRLLPLVPGLESLTPSVIERVGIAGKYVYASSRRSYY